MPSGLNPRFLQAASTISLTDSYTVTELVTTDADGRSYKAGFPPSGALGNLRLFLSSISGATEVTWFLALDSDGDIPLTQEKTSTITVGATTATKGGVSSPINTGYVIPVDDFNDAIYLVAKIEDSSGTATVDEAILDFHP